MRGSAQPLSRHSIGEGTWNSDFWNIYTYLVEIVTCGKIQNILDLETFGTSALADLHAERGSKSSSTNSRNVERNILVLVPSSDEILTYEGIERSEYEGTHCEILKNFRKVFEVCRLTEWMANTPGKHVLPKITH